jgi:hypothetical protein
MSFISGTRGVDYMARLEEIEVGTGVLLGNLKERDHLENLGVNWRIILKWMFKK